MDTHNNIEEKNPWLGLQAYTEDKTLYGRDDDIRALTQRVLSDNSLVLYGRSGIGKSSIINAGIIPSARRNGIVSISIRLDHQKGSSSYQSQIAESLKANGVIIKQHSQPSEHQLLWEFFHRNVFLNEKGERVKVLLIFDQFEEIFTLQSNALQKKHFFNEMADVLNDIMPGALHKEVEEVKTPVEIKESTTKEGTDTDDFGLDDFDLDFTIVEKPNEFVDDNEFHLVFTLREDFLSEFEYYTSTIPLLKQHRYGLRPLNEEQAAEIILKPRVGLVSKDVAKLIIEKVTQRTDFELDGVPEIEVDSAVLSLYLKSLYDSKTEDTITTTLVEQKGGSIITSFYNECIEDLNSVVVERLEDLLLNDEGRRDIKSLSILYKELGKEVVDGLIEKKLLRQFAYGGDFRVEFIHDILCKVVKDRKDQREQLRKQEQERQRQEEEKRRLHEEAERKQREIEEKAAREKAELEAEAQKTRKRNRRIYAGVASFLLVVLLGSIYYYFANIYTYKYYYKDFTRINGWPVGVGEQLSSGERNHTPLYYCLSHKGTKSPIMRILGIDVDDDMNTDVEVMSSNARLPHKPRVASFEVAEGKLQDEKAMAYNELLSNICKLHFVEGEDKTIEKEVAYNDKDSVLFVVNYFHINNSEMWGSFVSPSGQAMQIRENGIERTKVSLDSLGRARSLMYYDQNGVVQPISADICGYAWGFDEENNEEKRYILNQFSLPIESTCNMIITKQSGDTLITQYRHVLSVDDKVGTEAHGPEGFSLTKQIGEEVFMYVSETANKYSVKNITKDARGNVQTEIISNNLSSMVPAIINYTYDEDGNLIKLEKLSSPKTPFVVDENDDYLYEWEYSNGKTLREIRRNKTQITYQHTIETNGNVTKEVLEDVYANKYLIKVDSTFKDGYSTSYFGRNNEPINYKVSMEEDSITFHRKRCVIHENEELRYFYVFDGTEKKAPLIKTDWGQAISYYCKEIKRNNEGQIVSYKKRDENNRIVKSMMFITMNGQIIGRAVEGVDGTPVRCNNWEEEGYMYYKIYYIKDFEDNFVGIQGMNEWGQSSVFYDPTPNVGYQYVQYKDFKGYELILNSNRNVEVIRSYKQYVLNPAENISNFNYPYLHILDEESSLYKAGFKDGDRIVKFCNWSIGSSTTMLENEWNTTFSSGKNVKIEVLRPLPNGTVTRISKDVNCSQSSNDLQEFHVLALTTEEYNYLTNKTMLR